MNKLLSIIFLIFGLLFLLNLGYSAVTCNYIPSGPNKSLGWVPESYLNCLITTPSRGSSNILDLRSYPQNYNILKISYTNPTALTINNNSKNNLKFEIVKTYGEPTQSSISFQNNSNFYYTLFTTNLNLNITTNNTSRNLTNFESNNSIITFNNEINALNVLIKSNSIVNFNSKITIEDLNSNSSTIYFNGLTIIENANIINNSTISLDSKTTITKFLITNSIVNSDSNQIINDLNIINSNVDLNLIIPNIAIQNPFIKIKNSSNSEITINFISGFSNITNIFNVANITNSRNIILNGFEYNKIDDLNLALPTNILLLKDSNFITIQGFRLYSEKGIKNNNLTYIDLNNSLAIIKNNVFNDVNYPISSYDSNFYMYSNSTYNVEKVFNNNFGYSNIMFFNNFLKTIDNLDNLIYNLEYILSLDNNNSFGPAIDSTNYNCSQPTAIYPNFFDSTNNSDRNMPIYYYDPKTKSYVSYIYTPQCIGGNLYANKAIPNICGKNCFLFLLEGKNSKPDLIWDFSLKTKYTDIWDNAPLMFPLENYSDFVYETSDEYLSISFEIKNKEEIYLKDDNINFLVRIKPLPISVEGGFWSWLGSGNITFTFKDILINDKITIPIDETVNANAFLNCTKAFCREVDNVEYNFEIVFDDLNFELIKFEKISTGNENIEFKLNYDYNEITGMCEILNSLLENCNTTYCSEQEKNDILELLPQWCILKELSISQIIPLNVEGSAPTIKTPDNNVWIIMLLCISIMGIYLFGNRKKEFKCK